ncbi:MAG: oligosaccharide flippase family protein [Bacteroidales bacterium]|nr:oligosaccharide flippase family protein [Bacteroidales bacterium]
MKKKFFSNLLLLVSLNLVVKPFWIFGIDRTVQNVTGSASYGFYFSLFSFSLLLNILLDAGTTSYNNRVISRDPEKLSAWFSQLFLIRLLLAVVYVIVSIAIAIILGYSPRQLHLLWFLILNQFLASFILFFRSNITGLHLFKTDSVLSVADRVLMIILVGIVLWGHVTDEPFRIEWYVYLQTLAYGIVAVAAFILVLTKTKFFRPRFDKMFFFRIIRESFPFAMLTLLMALYYRIDSVMLERMLPDGARQAGIYAQAFRLLDAFVMYAYLFSVILLPLFSRMIKEDKPVTELVKFAFLLMMIPVLILGITTIIYRYPVMHLLYLSHTADSSGVLGVLMGALIFASSGYLFGTLLTARGDIKQLSWLAAGGFLLNIFLNFMLIPRFQTLGAAWASLVTQAGIGIIQILMVSHRFRISVSRMIPFQTYVFAGMITLTGLIIHGSGLRPLTGYLVQIFLSLLLAVIIKLIPLRQMISILVAEEE